jgi:ankyrin repeat protein
MRFLRFAICFFTLLTTGFFSEVQARSLPKLAPKVSEYFDGLSLEFVRSLEKRQFKRSKEMIENGVNVNQVGEGGMTALYWVILKHRPDALKFLLDHGADPNTITQWADADGINQSPMCQ